MFMFNLFAFIIIIIPKFDRIIASFPLLLNCDLHPEEGEDKEEKINILPYSRFRMNYGIRLKVFSRRRNLSGQLADQLFDTEK